MDGEHNRVPLVQVWELGGNRLDVVSLHREDDEILAPGGAYRVGSVNISDPVFFAVTIYDVQPAAADGGQMLTLIDEGYLFARLREHATHEAPDRAGADDTDSHAGNVSKTKMVKKPLLFGWLRA